MIGNCFSHVIGLIARDFMQNKLTWNGNQSLVPCDLNFDKFMQSVIKLESGLKRDWSLRVVATFETVKSLQLDLKFGAWVDLCRGNTIPLLAQSIKRSSAADEGLEEMVFIHFKSCLKALNLMCELTRIVEELDAVYKREKRPLKDVVEALTVLSFKEGTVKTPREHPTSNLESASKTF